jgi:hypothetical protein
VTQHIPYVLVGLRFLSVCFVFAFSGRTRLRPHEMISLSLTASSPSHKPLRFCWGGGVLASRGGNGLPSFADGHHTLRTHRGATFDCRLLDTMDVHTFGKWREKPCCRDTCRFRGGRSPIAIDKAKTHKKGWNKTSDDVCCPANSCTWTFRDPHCITCFPRGTLCTV